jgi:hypothetical protein
MIHLSDQRIGKRTNAGQQHLGRLAGHLSEGLGLHRSERTTAPNDVQYLWQRSVQRLHQRPQVGTVTEQIA